MTVEDLQAALEEARTLSDLLSEKGLDAVTVRERVQAAREAALEQAVADGVITQEQADQMSERMPPGGPGMRGFDRGNMPMPEDFEGKGGFGGRRPGNPGDDGTDDGTGGAGFRRPGRALPDSSAL
jgi:hypothetical protein